ncbi:MAG: NAD+ synthase [Candidatus Aenigmatarchaeota archaeon]|nr:MAG: NAD+ synthase [Candidatus Aenigmarchaeota archaeon]
MEKICEKIQEWILSKVREANAKGCVFGMSGGVDSSVVAILAKRALGGKALGLVLPCGSCPGDAHRANYVAKKFKIKTKKISLSRVFDSLKGRLPDADNKTVGNLKSRLRMLVLYYFANRYRYLVLGTSNRSELRIGYVTKYGDSGVDLEPIGDLYKTEVIELAEYLGIPKPVLKSTPTAGLWEGQTDRKEIGISYDRLDVILKAMDSRLKPISFDPRVVGRIKKMIEKSGHKRRMPEVCRLS